MLIALVVTDNDYFHCNNNANFVDSTIQNQFDAGDYIFANHLSCVCVTY